MQPRTKALKRILAATAVCAAVMVAQMGPASAFVAPYTPRFSDVPTTHTFYLEIEWLAAEGIANGYADGTYRPVAPVTRQAIAAFIYRYVNGAGPVTPCNTMPFTDVPKTHPFCGQIKWAKENGIVKGYPDGSFRPADAVQRQALAAFMYRLAGSPNGTHPTCSTAPFPDVPKTHPFCGEIKWAKAEGIVTGYTDGTFRPVSPVTRQAFAAILYNYDFDQGGSSVAVLGDEAALPTAGAPGSDDGTGGAEGTNFPATVGGTTQTATVITGAGNGATLPVTGGDVASVTVIGVLLLGGGALLVIGTRRRNDRSPSPRG